MYAEGKQNPRVCGERSRRVSEAVMNGRGEDRGDAGASEMRAGGDRKWKRRCLSFQDDLCEETSS